MKPLTMGMGLTGNQGIPGALLEDETKEKVMAKKKLGKGLTAAKNAAPKDVFCLTWIASSCVAEAADKLEEQGYSSSEDSAKARAARIRKAKRNPLDLPVLDGESASHKNWDKVQAALIARKSGDNGVLAQMELGDILKNG